MLVQNAEQKIAKKRNFYTRANGSRGAEAVGYPQLGRYWCLVSLPPGSGIKVMPSREKGMRNRRAAEVNADVEARIAQIEQMTLDQIAVFQCRILTDITTGRISPREASAIDRALRNRLKAIEQELREAG
jgi:hypothetical protein